MRKLDGVRRTSCGSDGGTEAENEATGDEMTLSVGGDLHGSADADDKATDENANTTAVTISEETAEREGGDLPNVVDDEDDASRLRLTLQPEGFLVRVHGVDGTHEGRVYASC